MHIALRICMVSNLPVLQSIMEPTWRPKHQGFCSRLSGVVPEIQSLETPPFLGFLVNMQGEVGPRTVQGSFVVSGTSRKEAKLR